MNKNNTLPVMGVTLEPDRVLKDKFILKIDKEGNWFYNNLPIINKKIYLFFNQHIEKDNGAGYILRVGNETCPLVVEDTPYVIVGIELIGPDSEKGEFFKIRLNDETEEELDLESFYSGEKNVPYCRVKNNTFPARFLRAPYYCLAEHIRQEGEDKFYLLLNGTKFYIHTTS